MTSYTYRFSGKSRYTHLILHMLSFNSCIRVHQQGHNNSYINIDSSANRWDDVLRVFLEVNAGRLILWNTTKAFSTLNTSEVWVSTSFQSESLAGNPLATYANLIGHLHKFFARFWPTVPTARNLCLSEVFLAPSKSISLLSGI